MWAAASAVRGHRWRGWTFCFAKVRDILLGGTRRIPARPGDDRLSRVLRRSTIGAEGFHGRVRDGIGCLPLAIATRPCRDQRSFAEQNLRPRQRCACTAGAAWTQSPRTSSFSAALAAQERRWRSSAFCFAKAGVSSRGDACRCKRAGRATMAEGDDCYRNRAGHRAGDQAFDRAISTGQHARCRAYTSGLST